MVPEDFTAENIVSLDGDIIASALEIGQNDVIDELCLSQQTEVEEEENDDDDKNSIKELLNQSQEKSSRSKIESALDVLKMQPYTEI